MVVEASLTTQSAKNAAADYRAITRRRLLAVPLSTALGGHAWLIELKLRILVGARSSFPCHPFFIGYKEELVGKYGELVEIREFWLW